MSSHCTVQQLSSYVDEELAPPELSLVESHLSDCSRCRDRLAGLGNVVRELRRVERAAPPSELGYRVERAVELAPRRLRLWQRGEGGARRWIDPPTVAPIFGVVLALAVIFYLAAVYSEKSQMRQQAPGTATRLVIAPPGSERQSAPAPREGEGVEVVEWRGRIFRTHDDGWWEEGIPAEIEPRVVELSEVMTTLGLSGPPLPEALRGPVRLRLGDEVVEVALPD